MDWLLRPWRRAVDFEGRSPRREYWLFVLQAWLLIGIPAFLLLFADHPMAERLGREPSWLARPAAIAMIAAVLTCVVPGLAVAVRRLNDQGRSAALLWLLIVPGGVVVLLVIMGLKGTPGDNAHGPDPRAPPPGPRAGLFD